MAQYDHGWLSVFSCLFVSYLKSSHRAALIDYTVYPGVCKCSGYTVNANVLLRLIGMFIGGIGTGKMSQKNRKQVDGEK